MNRTTEVRMIIRRPKLRSIAGSLLMLLSGVGLSSVAEATQSTTTGTITAAAIYSSIVSTPTMQGVAIFQVSSGIGLGCVWLWIAKGDNASWATVLAAKTTGASVSVLFESAIGAPWGDTTTCLAQNIQLN